MNHRTRTDELLAIQRQLESQEVLTDQELRRFVRDSIPVLIDEINELRILLHQRTARVTRLESALRSWLEHANANGETLHVSALACLRDPHATTELPLFAQDLRPVQTEAAP